jgi:isopentenyl-diphosphate delta-isomerase
MTDSQSSRAEIVSFDTEPLILVNGDDEAIGEMSKIDCHRGGGILHRAFSLFIFDAEQKLLVHRRSANKPLWGKYWTNSCCSHPRVGETMEAAVARRCEEELGFSTAMRFVYKFEYTAHFEDQGTEHELCSVYVGSFDGVPNVNTEEVSEVRWLSTSEVDAILADEQTPTTPWFAMEWQQLKARGLV